MVNSNNANNNNDTHLNDESLDLIAAADGEE